MRNWNLNRAEKSSPRFENLETRLVLSGTPPTVDQVSFGSSSWSTEFTDYLATSSHGATHTRIDGSEVIPAGYKLPVGTSDQLDPLPWTDINQIQIRFSEVVSVDAADLSLSGVNNASYDFSDFDYYPEIRLAVWTTATPLPIDRYLIDLDADGVDPVASLDGTVLDGEWTDSVSTVSGDGTAGGDFELGFKVLHGDTLGIDLLSYSNYYAISYRHGESTVDALYADLADIDGNGVVDSVDSQVVLDNYYESTPTGTPAGASDDAPTTVGFDATDINDDTVDVAFSLFDAFDDAEDSDSQLTYSIESISDPTLFDSVTIDSANGELVVNTAYAAAGVAFVTARAIDSSGNSTSASVKVRVNSPNSLPTLTATPTDTGSGIWRISGSINDVDNTPEETDSRFVTLTGFISAVVSVDENGDFVHYFEIDPGQGGAVWATTADEEGSSQAIYLEVGLV